MVFHDRKTIQTFVGAKLQFQNETSWYENEASSWGCETSVYGNEASAYENEASVYGNEASVHGNEASGHRAVISREQSRPVSGVNIELIRGSAAN